MKDCGRMGPETDRDNDDDVLYDDDVGDLTDGMDDLGVGDGAPYPVDKVARSLADDERIVNAGPEELTARFDEIYNKYPETDFSPEATRKRKRIRRGAIKGKIKKARIRLRVMRAEIAEAHEAEEFDDVLDLCDFHRTVNRKALARDLCQDKPAKPRKRPLPDPAVVQSPVKRPRMSLGIVLPQREVAVAPVPDLADIAQVEADARARLKINASKLGRRQRDYRRLEMPDTVRKVERQIREWRDEIVEAHRLTEVDDLHSLLVNVWSHLVEGQLG